MKNSYDERQCENHPIEFACIQIGEGTKEIDPRIAHHASKKEAIDHMHKYVNDGLIPMIGRVKVDNLIWGVKDRGKLLAVCFCCNCCCTILNSGKYLPDEVADRIVRLKGLEIKVDDEKCFTCETCIETCFMDAISIKNGVIERDEFKCKGCGLCISSCPEHAIWPGIENVDEAIDELNNRI